MSIKVIITGCCGRMGRALLEAVSANDKTSLAGGVEKQGSPFVGLDLGEIAGYGKSGIKIVSSLRQVISEADLVIDFSSASSALESFLIAAEYGKAVVIGTTGFDAEQKLTFENMKSSTRALISPNMSIGVNILFALAKKAAGLLSDYDAEIFEMHHNKKVDSPSGTAVRLAEVVASARNLNLNKVTKTGRKGLEGARTKDEIGLMTLRGGDVVGDHTLILAGPGERLELTHRAASRSNFANGAVKAGIWLVDQPNGLYDMSDMLNIKL